MLHAMREAILLAAHNVMCEAVLIAVRNAVPETSSIAMLLYAMQEAILIAAVNANGIVLQATSTSALPAMAESSSKGCAQGTV